MHARLYYEKIVVSLGRIMIRYSYSVPAMRTFTSDIAQPDSDACEHLHGDIAQVLLDAGVFDGPLPTGTSVRIRFDEAGRPVVVPNSHHAADSPRDN